MDAVLLSVEEAAQVLGLGRSKTYELLLKGQLRSIKIGRSRRVPVESINEFIRERIEEAGSDRGSLHYEV